MDAGIFATSKAKHLMHIICFTLIGIFQLFCDSSTGSELYTGQGNKLKQAAYTVR
jgi:hypothetical protein